MQNARRPKSILFWLASFCVPIILFCLITLFRGVYPFGPESFLTEDLLFQYIDFFAWFRGVLYGHNNLAYTGALSLGTNAWGIYSYYLASPFNLLIAAFSVESLTLAIYLIVALKLGTIQVTTTLYLHKRFGLPRLSASVLALCFSFSSWVMCNCRNPLWLDVCYIVPLAMLGAWQFLLDGKLWRVALPIAYAIITCWYMGYMAVLFLCIYITFESIVIHIAQPEFGLATIAKRAGGFALSMLLALGLSAWTFLPTVLAMAGNHMKTVYSFKLSSPPRVVLSSFFFGTYRRDVTPQLYMGSLPLILAGYHLFDSKTSAKERIVFLGFFGLLLAGVAIRPLYYVWCGFRTPLGFFCRNAFVVSLGLLWSAGAALASITKRGASPIALGCGTTLVLGIAAYCFYKNQFPSQLYAGLAASLILISTACIFFYGYTIQANSSTQNEQSHNDLWLPQFVALVLCACELAFSAWYMWGQLYTKHPHDEHEAYIRDSSVQLAELRSQDNGIYRVDKTFTRVGGVCLNEGMSQNYMQLSSYCSAHNVTAVDYLNALGYSNPGEISVRYAAPLALSDSLLGIKYIFENDPSVDSILYDEISLPSLDPSVRLLQNPNAISLGYLASPDVCDFEFDAIAEQPFELQNRMVSSIVGYELAVYEKVSAVQSLNLDGVHTWRFEVPAGKVGYCYMRGGDHKKGELFVSIDEGLPIMDSYRWRHTAYALSEGIHTVQIASTYEAAAGEELESASALHPDINCEFYLLDIETYNQVLHHISEHEMEFSMFEDGNIEGRIESTEPSYVLLTVPNERGWTAYLNGSETAILDALGGACMAIPVDAGINTISLHFEVPGLRVGIIVSAISLLFLLVRQSLARKPDKGTGGL